MGHRMCFTVALLMGRSRHWPATRLYLAATRLEESSNTTRKMTTTSGPSIGIAEASNHQHMGH